MTESRHEEVDRVVLPNFLICGAQKAGTTALYEYLSRHPDVFMSRPKETFFFDAHYERGLEWFSTHFEEHDGEDAIGEATTHTMYVPEAAARVAEHLPRAKLIFVLRNPIERAYSQYNYSVYTGQVQTNRSFHEIIRDEKSEFREEMIQRGMYVDQIHRFDRYYDRDQIKVILYEDLRRKTKEAVQDVYRFLNVDPSFSPDSVGEHNVTRYPESVQVYHWLRLSWQPMRDLADAWVPRLTTMVRRFARKLLFSTDRPEMKERDRRYLRTIYSEPNSHLEDRIGRDLSHWK